MSTAYVTQGTQGQTLERVSETDRVHKPERVPQTVFWKTVPGNSSCFTQVLQLRFLRVGSTYAENVCIMRKILHPLSKTLDYASI